MNVNRSALLTAVLMLFLLLSCGINPEPKIFDQADTPGIIDLRSWSFEEEGMVRLCRNLWDFYWRELLTPDDFTGSGPSADAVQIYGATCWNDLEIEDETLSADGFGTYRIRIQLPEKDVLYSFYMTNQDSAYRLWLDGREVASNGKVAGSRAQYRAQRLPRRFDHYASDSELEIVIQIANFTHKWGGLTNNIYMGYPVQIERFLLFQNGNAIFLSGAIIIMGIYHMFLSLSRKKERPPFYFSLICFFVGVWYLFSENYLMMQVFQGMPLAAGVRISYFLAYSLPPLYLLFFESEYRRILPRRFMLTVLIPGILLPAAALLTPLKLFSGPGLKVFYAEAFAVSVIVEYLLIKAVAERRRGAAYALIGFSLYFITVVYDIGAGLKLFNGSVAYPLMPLGLFLFIIIQSLMLAGRFTRAFDALDELTDNLEKKVKQRTLQLIQANKEKTERDKLAAIGTLVGGISHEVMNPLSGISGPVEVIRKEAERLPESDSRLILKHLGFIESNTSDITAAVRNLNALIKNKEVNKKPVNLSDVLSGCRERLSRTGEEIRLITEIPDDTVIDADESILLQIINNLVSNSIDAEAGVCRVRLETDRKAVLIIEDDGKGMSAEEAEAAFDAFFTTRQTEGGTGLGLFLVKRLAESLDWRVSLESVPGEGTTVFLSGIRMTD